MKAVQNLRDDIVKKKIAHAYLLIGKNDFEYDQFVDTLMTETKSRKAEVVEIGLDRKEGKRGEIKIEQMLTFLRQMILSSLGEFRIGLIKNCERLNHVSANAFLKTLEEPPKNVIFVLQSNYDTVIETIKSRCRTVRLSQSKATENHTKSYNFNHSDNLVDIFDQIEKAVKDGQTDEFIESVVSYLRSKMLEDKNKACCNLIERAEESRRRISGNANARLVIENLILEIKGNL